MPPVPPSPVPPKPPNPWIPPFPPQPDPISKLVPAVVPVTPVLEWRALDFAPGWEGFGRDVDGQFMIQTWRQKVGVIGVQASPMFQIRLPGDNNGNCPGGVCPSG